MPAIAASPPALVFLGHYYGTLATARCLGERGVSVVLADTRRFQRASGSRYIGDRVECPGVSDVDGFVSWLLDFGRARPGHVLFPASDELAWVFALHRDALAESFVHYGPPREAITAILDKWQLTLACKKVGIDTPETYCPDGDAEIVALSKSLTIPVMIKPRSQVLLTSGSKGAKVDDPRTLPEAYRAFVGENPPVDALSSRDPALGRPLVQEYRPEAAQGIYNLAGFIDRSGANVVVRASRKILQRPRRLGIGLCFEAAPLDPKLADGVMRLCRELGYYGIFEIEMIESDGRFLLIDFNPRPYSQMAFEIARGAPLPYLAYLDATGQKDELDRAVAAAQAEPPASATAYAHTLLLSLVIAGQRLGRPFGGEAPEPWARWLRKNRLSDAVFDLRDPLPVALDAAAHLEQFARHPRSFVRSLLR
jgi:predicted ATP-grasp superfamily ATP-dependent carboligase